MMIFLRGLGEFLTRGGDISGFPTFVAHMGQGTVFGIPVPLLIFIACVALWTILLKRTRLGFATHMIGSNTEATRYSGVDTQGRSCWSIRCPASCARSPASSCWPASIRFASDTASPIC